MKDLTSRDVEVLLEGEYFIRKPENATPWVCRYMRDMGRGEGWFKTGDVGGGNRSHHSATLKKLVKRGLVETLDRPKGSKAKAVWRVTETGIALAKEIIEKQRIERESLRAHAARF